MHNFTLINCDTDSISFAKRDGTPFTEEEQVNLLAELNSLYPPKIKFEHDGMFETVCILKAKNYILKAAVCKKCKKAGDKSCQHEARITKKGSSLKSSKIEPAIKEFMGEIINAILEGEQDTIPDIYNKYIINIHKLTDIKPYCSKKTITESVLNPERTNEEKVLDALRGRKMQMGDKIYTYYAEEKTVETQVRHLKKGTKTVEKETITNPLRLAEDWDPARPNHSVDKLIQRLYNTLVIFKNVIDMEKFPKYHLKGKQVKEQLNEILTKHRNTNFKEAVEEFVGR